MNETNDAQGVSRETLVDLDIVEKLGVLPILLEDRTRPRKGKEAKRNIVWGTDSYAALGEKYQADAPIERETLDELQKNEDYLFLPRAQKELDERRLRSKKRAEVFTPNWVCNLMNEFCDAEWLRRADKFDVAREPRALLVDDYDWSRSKSRKWKRYVDSRRLEITCGEAPFIVSRYDASNGRLLPLDERNGILDRKLRVVDKNVAREDESEWFKWTLRAFQSVYGYEFQGDNLLVARLNLFLTFTDYYRDRGFRVDPERDDFDKVLPSAEYAQKIAEAIAYNFWQMDGLTNRVIYPKIEPSLFDNAPDDAPDEPPRQGVLFDGATARTPSNPKKNRVARRDASPAAPFAIIRNWRAGSGYGEAVVFNDLKKRERRRMKFDYIVGNPPYQEEIEGNTRARPVYNNFMDQCYEIGTKVLLITPGRFLTESGFTPSEWDKKMLSDEHLMVLWSQPNSEKIFKDTDIKGGVVITFRDADKVFGAIGTFFRYEELKSIYSKVMNSGEFISFSNIVFGYNQWNVTTLFAEYPELRRTRNVKKISSSALMDIPFVTETGGVGITWSLSA